MGVRGSTQLPAARSLTPPSSGLGGKYGRADTPRPLGPAQYGPQPMATRGAGPQDTMDNSLATARMDTQGGGAGPGYGAEGTIPVGWQDSLANALGTAPSAVMNGRRGGTGVAGDVRTPAPAVPGTQLPSTPILTAPGAPRTPGDARTPAGGAIPPRPEFFSPMTAEERAIQARWDAQYGGG